MQSLVLLALVSVASAGLPALISTGASSQYRSQDVIGNYAFGYNEGSAGGATFRKESGDASGNKVGAYGLQLADGRVRTVNYVADAAGFRANIQTNEPGVEPKDPANVLINKAIVAAPARLLAAAPAYQGPRAIAAPLLAGPAPLAYGYGAHGLAAPALSGYAGNFYNRVFAAPALSGYAGNLYNRGFAAPALSGYAGNLYSRGFAAPYGYGAPLAAPYYG